MSANPNPVPPPASTGTRENILKVANDLVLSQGYAATSLDQILEKAGVTKGAFFYYFKSKAELAEALIERYAQMDQALMTDMFAQAEKLSRDPLQQIQILMGLFEQMFENAVEPPGCLLASYIYQSALHTEPILKTLRGVLLAWRQAIEAKLREAAAKYPPKDEVDFEALADLATTMLEGAFVLGRTFGDPKLVARQLRQYRNYLDLLFSGK
jgi:TetR/AcrR family transcriptional repressor of nem operon